MLADTWQELFSALRRRVQQLYAYLNDVPPTALQVTGVVGLLAFAYAIYQFRASGKGPGEHGAAPRGTQPAASAPSASGHANAKPARGGLQGGVRAAGSSMASQLTGVRSVTISAPGVLLEEWTPSQLNEGATLRPEAAAVVREMCKYAMIYLIAHVTDDLGEATVRGALEAGGVTGSAAGQIPLHRVVTCSTLEGKVSIVRQLDPELHIDGHHQTIEDLKRFMPQLLHIRQQDAPPAAQGAPNVGSAPSLKDALGSS